jgi:trimeric autotransporter adhesin
MHTYFKYFLLLISFHQTFAQNVGINTTDPKALLDIRVMNPATPSATDGILIPKVDNFPISNPTAAQEGMLVFLTANVGPYPKGFYYWDNATTTWKAITAPAAANNWGLSGNAGTNPTNNFIGTTDLAPLHFKVNNEKAGLIDPNGPVFLGYGAGKVNSGFHSTGIGYQALTNNTTGFANTSIGNRSLYTNTTGSWNIASGFQSLYSNTTGSNNVASGGQSLYANTTGSNNIASGTGSLYSNTIGSNNIALGNSSLLNNTIGEGNIASGFQSLYSNTTGNSNVASGHQSLYSNTTGFNNLASGYQSLYSNTEGSNNVAHGYQALYSNVAGSKATAIGSRAMEFANSTTTPFDNTNVAVGYEALRGSLAGSANNTGINNSVLGYSAMRNNTTGTNNVANGSFALRNNTTGSSNIANGSFALTNNTTGSSNVATGTESMYQNTTGSANVASGYQSLFSNTTGANNTAIGNLALENNIDGINNTAVGNSTLSDNTTGFDNTALGALALMQNTVGYSNLAMGATALFQNTAGNYNTAIGNGASYNTNTGSHNISIGYLALGNVTSGDNNIAIGKDTDVPNPTGSNQLSIGNVIYGTGIGAITGNIGIGIATPTEKLDVAGKTKTTELQITNNAGANKVLISDGAGNATWESQGLLNNWGLNGNTGTTPGVHFIGTTDDKDLILKRNNVLAGNISIYSTSIGSGSLSNLPVGNTSYNAAFGTNALFTNATGSSNSAFGINALRFNLTGSSNTAVGRESATSNTSASHNTAVGAHTLYYNATGENNTAVGSGALQNNTNGNNTAIGKGVLNANTTGYGNTALGSEALLTNTIGNQNIAMGVSALRGNTLGGNNTAIGTDALKLNTGGSGNVAIGTEALNNNVTGANNIAIGYRAGKNNASTGNNNIAIGANAEVVNGAVNDQISIANLIYANGATGIANAGNVGIGTNNPSTKLEVAGTTKTTTLQAANIQMTTGAFNNAVLRSDASGNASWVGVNSLPIAETDPQVGGQVTNQVPRWDGGQLVNGNICDNGWVGLFNTSPQAPFHVANSSGTVTAGSQQRSYFHVNTGSNIIQDVSSSGNVVIRADGYIWANGGGFVATSDARIKNIKGITDNQKDLATLSRIEITNYKYKDEITNGATDQKKVIAQQLKSVYPIAVNQSTGVIPNVFEVAKLSKIVANKTEITTNKAHDFATGDEVKLILDKSGEKTFKVTVSNATTFFIDEIINETIFVYGKKVKDLLNVDYDALTTLNISATQELVKRIDALEKENAKLQSVNKEIKATLESIIKEIRSVKSDLNNKSLVWKQ